MCRPVSATYGVSVKRYTLWSRTMGCDRAKPVGVWPTQGQTSTIFTAIPQTCALRDGGFPPLLSVHQHMEKLEQPVHHRPPRCTLDTTSPYPLSEKVFPIFHPVQTPPKLKPNPTSSSPPSKPASPPSPTTPTHSGSSPTAPTKTPSTPPSPSPPQPPSRPSFPSPLPPPSSRPSPESSSPCSGPGSPCSSSPSTTNKPLPPFSKTPSISHGVPSPRDASPPVKHASCWQRITPSGSEQAGISGVSGNALD